MWFNGGPPGPPHHGPPPPGHPLHGLPHPAYPPGHPLHLPPGVQMMPMGGPHTVMPGMPMGAMPPLPPMTPMGQMQQNGGPSGSHQMMGPSTSGPPPSQPRGRPAHRGKLHFWHRDEFCEFRGTMNLASCYYVMFSA
ncbi:hypothetical protein CRE_14735 [Caenorhabditis remanei]|uniref:Uncharacterized protein n=1 Tax=Caenorhabditis remanei TaxID=31234 RepID=E3MRM5_CAERE|nr:hypothetical protein CRE_14735 [Caenorhabditis remanei]